MKTFALAAVVALLVSPALADEMTVNLKKGAGLDKVEGNCAACHTLAYIPMNSPFLNAAGWDAEVNKMIKSYGAPIDEAADVRANGPGPVELLIADEERRILEQAMAGLSERQRGAIALFHMEGLSGEESAQAMDLSAKAFESLLGRARARLKENVQKIQNTGRCA